MNKKSESINIHDDLFSEVYFLQKKDITRASLVFSRAFFMNPMFTFLIPDEAQRRKKLKYIFEYIVRYGYKFGIVYSPSSELSGISVWIPSKFSQETIFRQIHAGGFKVVRKVGFGIIKKQSILMSAVNEAHNHATRDLKNGFIHLSSICVEPKEQGKGIASQLFSPMIKYSQKTKIPLYLETAKEDNIHLYEHFGFEDVANTPIPKTDFINHGMVYRPDIFLT